jgi:antitoxin CcdA
MGKAELKIDIDQALLEDARRLDIDIGKASADGLRRALAQRRLALRSDDELKADAKAWAQENAVAIEAHRRRIERDGVFGEDFRTW